MKEEFKFLNFFKSNDQKSPPKCIEMTTRKGSYYRREYDSTEMQGKNCVQMLEFPPSPDSPSSPCKNGYQLGRPALVKKTGQYRVRYKGLKSLKVRPFFKDLYQTLIDIKWRWAVFFFCMAFLAVYFIFAVLWYLLSYVHKDFSNLDNPNWVPCVHRMRNFADAMLFSIETQTTIGFGTMYPNTSCIGSLPLTYIQITVGFLLETILVGYLLVKIARPKQRRFTLMFSDNACISMENGEVFLQVRVGDMRQSHLIDTHAYGIYISDKISAEGTVYPLYQTQMEFQAHGMDSQVFLMWPIILRHKIDEKSPLWQMKYEDILANTFEIIFVLEGTIESTGEICQARTSYTSKDIQWGYRFENMVDFNSEKGQWQANFRLFNELIISPMPKISAKTIAELYRGRGDEGYAEKNSELTCGRRSQSQTLYSVAENHDDVNHKTRSCSSLEKDAISKS